MHTISVKTTVEHRVKFLRVEACVRDWEDGEVNGVADDNDKPTIPFSDKILGLWKPLIDIDTGTILDWPAGTTASIHYKVCDDGAYALLDPYMKPVIEIEGYVPRMLCPKDNGYGDYIIMDIGADGAIANWRVDFDKFEADED